jgi:hypothetical protein
MWNVTLPRVNSVDALAQLSALPREREDVRRFPLSPRARMSDEFEKNRVDWLYGRFQGITDASDGLTKTIGILIATTIVAFESSQVFFKIPILEANLDRVTFIGCFVGAAAFALVAFLGNFEQGESTLHALEKVLGCHYPELWLVDTKPSMVDYALNYVTQVPKGSASKKHVAIKARILNAGLLVRPLLLVTCLLILGGIWETEVITESLREFKTLAVYGGSLILLAWCMIRSSGYIRRRLKTWWHEGVPAKTTVKKTLPETLSTSG